MAEAKTGSAVAKAFRTAAPEKDDKKDRDRDRKARRRAISKKFGDNDSGKAWLE